VYVCAFSPATTPVPWYRGNRGVQYPVADFNDHNIVYYGKQGSWVKVPPS
jgi:hypothetical protein